MWRKSSTQLGSVSFQKIDSPAFFSCFCITSMRFVVRVCQKVFSQTRATFALVLCCSLQYRTNDMVWYLFRFCLSRSDKQSNRRVTFFAGTAREKNRPFVGFPSQTSVLFIHWHNNITSDYISSNQTMTNPLESP